MIVNLYYDPFVGDDGCLAPAVSDAKRQSMAVKLTALNTILANGATAASFATADPDFTGHGLGIGQPYVQGVKASAPFHPQPRANWLSRWPTSRPGKPPQGIDQTRCVVVGRLVRRRRTALVATVAFVPALPKPERKTARCINAASAQQSSVTETVIRHIQRCAGAAGECPQPRPRRVDCDAADVRRGASESSRGR